MSGRVLIGNMHYGITCVWEFPQAYVDLEDEELWHRPDRPWEQEPSAAQVSVLFNDRARRSELADIVFARDFVALSVRSTPREFLDFVTIEVQFVPYPGVAQMVWAQPASDDHVGQRYWLGAPGLTTEVGLVEGDRAETVYRKRGLAGLHFSFSRGMRDGHVRWCVENGPELLVVSTELWSHWERVGVSGVLDALLLPEGRFIVRGSRRNVGVPPGTIADPCD